MHLLLSPLWISLLHYFFLCFSFLLHFFYKCFVAGMYFKESMLKCCYWLIQNSYFYLSTSWGWFVFPLVTNIKVAWGKIDFGNLHIWISKLKRFFFLSFTLKDGEFNYNLRSISESIPSLENEKFSCTNPEGFSVNKPTEAPFLFPAIPIFMLIQ